GSVGSQFFSFLATNDHFSSNCSSRVRGGKGDPLVVQAPGVAPGPPTVAGDGLAVDPAEPPGLADAAPLGHVLQDGLDLLRVESGAEQRGALALGEAGLAGAAPQHAALLVGAVAAGHGQGSGVALAVVGAAGIQAAEAGQVIHGAVGRVRSLGLIR